MSPVAEQLDKIFVPMGAVIIGAVALLFVVAGIVHAWQCLWSESWWLSRHRRPSFDLWIKEARLRGEEIEIIRNPQSIIVMSNRRHTWKYQRGRWHSADFRGQWCWIGGEA